MSLARRALPALLLGAGILVMAGPWGSPTNTKGLLLGIGLTGDVVELLNRTVRTVGHFLAYAVFALLVLRAIRGDRPATGRLTWLALGAAAALASVDEAIQVLSPVREGKITDVLLDSAGAAVALWLVLRRARAGRETASPAP